MTDNKELTYSVPAPPLRTKFLVFDVETTGLLPRQSKTTPTPISQYPHIIQLSFAVYDLSQRKVILEYDSYVRLEEDVVLPEKVVEITKITKAKCRDEGRDICVVLEKFYEAYMFCEGLVAHNIDFDEKMIQVELERNREKLMKSAPYCFMTFNTMYERVHGIDRYCTMKKGTDLCNIYHASPDGKKDKKKWPSLKELYTHLNPTEPITGLHNSMVDVKACLRCYLKMRHNIDDKSVVDN